MHLTVRPLALVLLAGLLLPASRAGAQSSSASPAGSDQWHGLVPSALTTVFVQEASGVETRGKLLALSPESVTILVDRESRRFDLATVTRVQRRDSLRNGTIIGAVVGVVMGAISSGLADCSYDHGGGCAGFRLGMVALSTGVYAGLGAGIDALIPGRTTIYSASAPSSHARLPRPSRSDASLLRVGMSISLN